MLILKPNCEACDRDLPPHATEAMICSYECTFCLDCVNSLLSNVCPNCGGGFTRRPVRPKTARREGVSLAFQPASTERVLTTKSDEEIKAFAAQIKAIAPWER
ncbi:DUF1272 domain-containing protein [Alteromonas lipolytica]|uniref:Urease n=1 Tax=Alteromonas lipolytica TaxID=1856405 RepID=A0A1E8FFX4_9ALTE|nr:DUF1272 domain-containing protein [Alteromonas lipolytica]OFI34857.1 urease [Alteromonas lipolytica]GGF54558.1 urease [Alteromonas lipolytica]